MTSLGKDFFAEKINGSPPLVNEVFTEITFPAANPANSATPIASVPAGVTSILFTLTPSTPPAAAIASQDTQISFPLGFDIEKYYVEVFTRTGTSTALDSDSACLYFTQVVAEIPAVPGGAAAVPPVLHIRRQGALVLKGSPSPTPTTVLLDYSSVIHVRMIPFTTKTLA